MYSDIYTANVNLPNTDTLNIEISKISSWASIDIEKCPLHRDSHNTILSVPSIDWFPLHRYIHIMLNCTLAEWCFQHLFRWRCSVCDVMTSFTHVYIYNINMNITWQDPHRLQMEDPKMMYSQHHLLWHWICLKIKINQL